MVVRCKAQVCSRLVAGIVGSNPAEGTDVRLMCFLCVVGSGLCDGLITRSEECYQVCVSIV